MNKCLPNTFLIGVQKAGTTSYYDWLTQHPMIYGEASMKDYNFFLNDDLFKLGLKWFSKSFDRYKNEDVVIHGHVQYVCDLPTFHERVNTYGESKKIILVIREPVSRCYSAYWEGQKTARINNESFEQSIFSDSKFDLEHINSSSSLIYEGLYLSNILKSIELFGADNVLVLHFDDIKKNPEAVMRNSFEFLGVDSSYSPNFRVENESGRAKSRIIQKIIQNMKVPSIVKKHFSGRVLWQVKSFLVRRLNAEKFEYPEINDDVAKVLTEYYKVDYHSSLKFCRDLGV